MKNRDGEPGLPEAAAGRPTGLVVGVVVLAGGLVLALTWRPGGDATIDPASGGKAFTEGAGPDRTAVERAALDGDRPSTTTGTAGPWVFTAEERRHYDRFTGIARGGGAALEAAVLRTLDQPATAAARIAALRYWYDNQRTDRYRLFRRVLLRRETTDEVRRFAARFALERARDEPAARAVLARYLATHPGDLRHRAEGSFAIMRWGDDLEILRHLPFAYAERTVAVLEQVAAGLAQNSARAARGSLDELQARHPSAAVRRAIEQVRRRLASGR